jgi:hypothetical protein
VLALTPASTGNTASVMPLASGGGRNKLSDVMRKLDIGNI